MSSRRSATHHYTAIKGKMQRVAKDHERQVNTAWVDRVLEVLDSDKLIARAASGVAADDSLVVDCNVAPLVWDDPRIAHRRRQLEGSGVIVELNEHEQEIAGKTFRRAQILVFFGSQHASGS